jgi:hypothetical protein
VITTLVRNKGHGKRLASSAAIDESTVSVLHTNKRDNGEPNTLIILSMRTFTVPSSKAVTAHRLLCFTVAGIIYGLALSAPTAFVFLVLRSRMTFAHGSNYPRDWLQVTKLTPTQTK